MEGGTAVGDKGREWLRAVGLIREDPSTYLSFTVPGPPYQVGDVPLE